MTILNKITETKRKNTKTCQMMTAIAGTAPNGTSYTCETNYANASTHAITSVVAQKRPIECIGNCPYST
jgi:hypothetical protein